MASVDARQSDQPLNMRVDRREGVAVVTLEGSCTMDVSDQIRQSLVDLVSDKMPALVIDMSRLDFIDSTGLGGIVAAHLRARRHHGVIRLVNPQPAIREVLSLTRLVQLFSIDPTVESAVTAATHST